MFKVIAGFSIALLGLVAHAAPAAGDQEAEMLRVVSRVNPAQYEAVQYLASTCRISPNRDSILALLISPVTAEVSGKIASGNAKALGPEVCASLSPTASGIKPPELTTAGLR